ncbi:MAG: type II secretion system protein GspC [Gammaproteobacteria bacterium]|nr:type II secretion system protein GspC [Gammaproteobacteria bacterium]
MKVEQVQAKVYRATQEWASLFTPMSLEKWLRRAPKMIEVLLVILLAKAAADISWLIFSPAPTPGNASVSLPAARQAPTQQPRLQAVANLHIFGMPSVATGPAGAAINAVKTGLKLSLRGVFASDIPENSMAIVADDQNQEKVYVRGDTVVPGVTLQEVYPDRIILNRSGNYETLSMPTEGKDLPGQPTRPGRATLYNPALSAAAPARTTPASGAERLRDLRQELVTRPDQFWNQVRIDPYQEDGVLKGFRFTHRDPQVMAAIGLQPSDVVVDVNGSPATDPAVMQSIMSNNGGTITLGVLRGGQRIELRVSM